MTDSPNQTIDPGQKSNPKMRFIIFVLVIIGAILFAAWFVWSQKNSKNGLSQSFLAVVGTIYPITPLPRPLANGAAAGNPKAGVTIDVYEDFQCPACKEYSQTIEPQVMRNLVVGGQVHYVFHSFLIIDRATWDSPQKESHQAANAAMCAADQNRFWDYHDILFNNWTGENVGDFTDARLLAYAKSLNLNINLFNACFTSNKFKATIDGDITQARKLGVNGTPSIFVNGVQVTPGYIPGYSQIADAVNKALGK